MVSRNNSKMYVLKRDGRKEEVYFDKITSRIQKLSYGLNRDFVVPAAVTLKVTEGIYTGITTVELDNLAAQVASRLATKHPDYAILAGRIAISNLHKETKKTFSDVIEDLYNASDPQTKKHMPLISEYHYGIVKKHATKLNAAVIYDRDYNYSYSGFKMLESCYLLKINGKVIERPQHMLMRVAVAIHGEDCESAIETYNMMSEKYFIHASPTLLNAGSPKSQLSSSFLVTMKDDSIEGIFDTVKRCTVIAKCGGGVGLNIHCIRAKGSYISGTKGTSTGVVPMLRVYNTASRFVEFGVEKELKTFSVYLEPWHSDILEFLELSKSTGEEENRARDLYLAIWVPDLFMERVERDGDWCLMCPRGSPGLSDCWGEEFDKLYTSYEEKGQYVKKVKARSIWFKIIASQIETGTPYVLYKDACNRKSNQQNVGTVKAGNLSGEVVEYSSPDEVAVCSSASIALNAFVKPDKTYDFAKLKEVAKVVTRNLNKVIDVNYYPLPEAERCNKRHRPIGIGVQGLADAFTLMRLPFDSAGARDLNIRIFETLYYGALEASCELAAEQGPYETYEGSPASKGILQYDMWNAKPTELWNWSALKEKIARHGVRNSLLIALAPTSTTAQILGNSESFEPYASMRGLSSGEFQVLNPNLMYDLADAGLWHEDVKKSIEASGSIQNVAKIPDELKALYKTVWEIPQKVVVQMAADRAPFVDQSQSVNVHIASPNVGNLSSMHFYGWKSGLKTGMSHLRSKPTTAGSVRASATKEEATTDASNVGRSEPSVACLARNKDECLACSA